MQQVISIAVVIGLVATLIALLLPPRPHPAPWVFAKRLGISAIVATPPGTGQAVIRVDAERRPRGTLRSSDGGIFAFVIKYAGKDGAWHVPTGRERSDWPVYFTVRERPGDLWSFRESARWDPPNLVNVVACTIAGRTKEGRLELHALRFDKDTVDLSIQPREWDAFGGMVQELQLRRFAVENEAVARKP